jgi:CubicO group peptidase (beta-lactamase class C family)
MKTPNEFKHTVSFIEEELSSGTFPGAALAVMLGDRLVAERYWGNYCSRTRRDNPVDASTVHMLWSFSKGITSTVFAMFLADGVVDLDAPVSRYIPNHRLTRTLGREHCSDSQHRHRPSHRRHQCLRQQGMPNPRLVGIVADARIHSLNVG